jgi:hypothetical protein
METAVDGREMVTHTVLNRKVEWLGGEYNGQWQHYLVETFLDEACSTVEILVESTAVQVSNDLECDAKILSLYLRWVTY